METDSLTGRFAADGYLPLPDFLTADGLRVLRQEAGRLEREEAARRDFTMESMAHSPRHMTTVGGHRIAQESGVIANLYRDPALLALLSTVFDRRVVPVEQPVERHVLNILHRPGDTHGAHTDDYPLALVLFIDAPPRPADGGLLEFAPGTADLEALGGSGTRSLHHHPGHAYLLRSDLTAHRVTPLNRHGVRRTVLNFAYTVPDRQTQVTDSASRLYE
ncbi:hypothetical protein [Streptomyces sp. NBC_00859]|uniref:HalD/BesD family halogenase n=1 Tax=Streptomyces sp. NBC_00859 TaxID=2903682 RepID=UPI0038657403|nr:hypothetical protein OG584_32390 [Streptomyces sp. NBC_00859]